MRQRLQAKLVWARENIFVYIGGLFLVSRFIYIALGDVSIRIFDKHIPVTLTVYSDKISTHLPIQMWYVWDAVHYGRLADMFNFSLSKLTPTQTMHGVNSYYLLHWFPLYPILAKVLHVLTRLSIPYSLLLISNLCFFGSLYLLYRLMRFDGHDDKFAKRVVTLLVLLPMSFVFSAALSESLFLFLALATIYCARRERWLLAGACGLLLSLTRSEGFLIVLPLAVEALQQYGWKPHFDFRRYTRPAIACLMTVLGLFIFMLYSWLRTDSPLAYIHSQQIGSAVSLGNPLTYAVRHLINPRTLLVLGELGIVAIAWKKLRWSYVAYATVFIVIALAIGNSAAASMLRYVSFVFPVAIAAAYLMKRQDTANFIWLGFGILNGALFIMWANWWTGFII